MAGLFHPVGLHELSLLCDLGFREFPLRLAHRSFFYPVASADYARQIAAHWNVKDRASGFAGFVTAFGVPDDYPLTLGEAMAAGKRCGSKGGAGISPCALRNEHIWTWHGCPRVSPEDG